jgi:hypothetical protein
MIYFKDKKNSNKINNPQFIMGVLAQAKNGDQQLWK